MFTGIIEEIGQVEGIIMGVKASRLRIGCRKVLDGTKPGDSICTSGVCLTVAKLGRGFFEADVMAETMRRSRLGSFVPGGRVNLERAMGFDGRFGGHFVSGHVDGTGIIRSIEREENAVWVSIAVKKELLRYIVEKGSIAVDGVSLTVAAVPEDFFKVSIIPVTGKETALLAMKPGEQVNLECDIIGKYVEKLLYSDNEQAGRPQKVTEELLRRSGF